MIVHSSAFFCNFFCCVGIRKCFRLRFAQVLVAGTTTGGGATSRPPARTVPAVGQSLHGRSAATTDATDDPQLLAPLHNHARGQDGRLFGNGRNRVPHPSALLQAQDEEHCVDERHFRTGRRTAIGIRGGLLHRRRNDPHCRHQSGSSLRRLFHSPDSQVRRN